MVMNIAKSFAVGVFLFGTANIQAAPQAPDRDDPGWYQSRDSFYRAEGWRMRLFDRVKEDLDRVQDVTFHHKDEHRIARTEEQLSDLQSKLAAGRFDRPEVDAVIGSLTTVVADNRLAPRDRDMLSDDLSRLRDYRDHHGDWH